jgi:hypothetical protein
MDILRALHSLAESATALASLVLLGLNGSQDVSFIAVVSVFAVLAAASFIDAFLAWGEKGSKIFQRAWMDVRVFVFIAGMIVLGQHGTGNSSFLALFSVWTVLETLQLIVPVMFHDGLFHISFSLAGISSQLFIASMVIVGTGGIQSP